MNNLTYSENDKKLYENTVKSNSISSAEETSWSKSKSYQITQSRTNTPKPHSCYRSVLNFNL